MLSRSRVGVSTPPRQVATSRRHHALAGAAKPPASEEDGLSTNHRRCRCRSRTRRIQRDRMRRWAATANWTRPPYRGTPGGRVETARLTPAIPLPWPIGFRGVPVNETLTRRRAPGPVDQPHPASSVTRRSTAETSENVAAAGPAEVQRFSNRDGLAIPSNSGAFSAAPFPYSPRVVNGHCGVASVDRHSDANRLPRAGTRTTAGVALAPLAHRRLDRGLRRGGRRRGRAGVAQLQPHRVRLAGLSGGRRCCRAGRPEIRTRRRSPPERPAPHRPRPAAGATGRVASGVLFAVLAREQPWT